jgi:hypothetical protein
MRLVPFKHTRQNRLPLLQLLLICQHCNMVQAASLNATAAAAAPLLTKHLTSKA